MLKLTKRGIGCAELARSKKLPKGCEKFQTYFKLFVWK